MLVVYIDEFGNIGDFVNGGFMIFVLGCVFVDVDNWLIVFDGLLSF